MDTDSKSLLTERMENLFEKPIYLRYLLPQKIWFRTVKPDSLVSDFRGQEL